MASPFLLFAVLMPLGWSPIYPGILAMSVGAALTLWCRPDLTRSVTLGAGIFVVYYAVFLVGLELTAPGYVGRVWNLGALSGIRLGTVPLEEFLFALGFGGYWAGVYEHLTWGRPLAVGPASERRRVKAEPVRTALSSP